jgi:hypothetical protein
MIETLDRPTDEFYIGYEPSMPAGIARRVVGALVMFSCAAVAGIAVSLGAQHTLAPSRFDFGIVKPVAGTLRRDPYPWLQVEGRRVWLVAPGKFGADRLLEGIPDGPVTVDGSAIERGKNRMLEVTGVRPGSDQGRTGLGSGSDRGQTPVGVDSDPGPTPVRVDSDPGPTPVRADSDPGTTLVTLSGEIVDSKCFLGVMNPGEGAVHRDCARRCLSGGIPPMLLVRDGGLREELVVLVSEAGRPLGPDIRSMAGRAVTVSGRLVRDGDTWILFVRSASSAVVS